MQSIQIGSPQSSSINTLAGFYLPACWLSLACCSIATCCKALCSVACDDARPDESLTSLAESCMLLLIKSFNVCLSIFYVIYKVTYHTSRSLRESFSSDGFIYC